jgi:hypothetical protein
VLFCLTFKKLAGNFELASFLWENLRGLGERNFLSLVCLASSTFNASNLARHAYEKQEENEAIHKIVGSKGVSVT